MDSLRSATKNTMFESWLDATMARASPLGKAVQEPASLHTTPPRPENLDALADVAPYLQSPLAPGEEDPSSPCPLMSLVCS